MTSRILAFGLACFVAVAALSLVGNVSAGGDQVQHNHQTTHGEEGYYEENNNNPFDDDTFPGQPLQNRTGVDE